MKPSPLIALISLLLFGCVQQPSVPTPQPPPESTALLPTSQQEASPSSELSETALPSATIDVATLAPSPTVEPATSAPTAVPANPYNEIDPSGQAVVYWHNHLAVRLNVIEEFVADFNATNTYGITVEQAFIGGTDDLYTEVQAALETGNPPDVVVAYQNQAADYRLAEAVVDLNLLLDSPTWGIDESAFYAPFIDADVSSTFDGGRLGFPPNRSMEIMYANLDWLATLREADAIDFDGLPQNPDAFRQAACAAAEGDATGYAITVGASPLASWTFAFGGDIFDEDIYTYDDPAAIAAMNYLQGLVTDGCARLVTERFGDQTAFGAGNALFTVGTSSGLSFYQRAVRGSFNWDVGPLPYISAQPRQNVYGPSLSIMQSTPEREVASWLFITYLTEAEQQAEWAAASGYFPVREDAAEELKPYLEANPAYAHAFELIPYGMTEPGVPGYDAVRALAAQAMEDILTGAEVESTLATLNREANAVLATQK